MEVPIVQYSNELAPNTYIQTHEGNKPDGGSHSLI